MPLKIVIADDEKMVAELLADNIKKMDIECDILGVFKRGKEVIDFVKHNVVDIVLTDIMMPEMDGLELAKELNDMGFPGKVVILTGYSNFEYARKAISYKVAQYLLKPIDIEELENVLIELKNDIYYQKSPTIINEIETYECFFIDLITGMYNNGITDEKLDEIGINCPRNSAGSIFKISVSDELDNDWNYDFEFLQGILYNILKMGFREFVCPISSTHLNYYFAFFTDKIDANDIKHKIESVKKIDIKVEKTAVFQNLTDIKNCIIGNGVDGNWEQFNDKENDESNFVKIVNDYIAKNYHNNITRDMVAGYVYMSPSYFSKMYKKLTGMTFFEKLTKVRMEKAIELINEHQHTIAEISEMVGYRNRRYFNKAFTDFTGYSPKEYEDMKKKEVK